MTKCTGSGNALIIRLTTPNGSLPLNYPVPVQELTLKYVRVQMVDAPGAVGNPMLTVRLGNMFGPTQLNNNSVNTSYLPVFNSSLSTNDYTPDLPLQMQTPLNPRDPFQIYATTGEPLGAGNMVSMDLIFSYGDSRI